MDLEFNGSGAKEISFGWHLNLKISERGTGAAIRDAHVRITDAQGTTVFEGNSDVNGLIAADLLEYTLSNAARKQAGGQKSLLTPHVIIAEIGDRKVSRTVRMESNITIEIEL